MYIQNHDGFSLVNEKIAGWKKTYGKNVVVVTFDKPVW
jgi:hypothetical protein